ncbi:MAG TPA: F0F1 ATP synthase subunit A [Marmoricola sp.]|nr:F0F1 ATP synthase subunit A [Marmoricola sp.]
MGLAPLTIDIHPGVHPEGHLFGQTLNLDTIRVTILAGLIVLVLGFLVRSALTKKTDDHVPTKLQLFWELIVTEVTTQVEQNLGKVNPFVVPLAVALFFFILISNWIELVPTEINKHHHFLPSPTADTNLTYAMAIMVMVGVWTFSIRERGFKGFVKHYFEPVPWMAPLEILQDLLKPVTLALRLFGNIFAGGIMLALIGGMVSLAPAHIPLGSVLTIVFGIVWKLFDTLFLGGLQAFIFALLTVLYFGMAGAHGHGDDHDEHDEHNEHNAQPELAA